MSNAYSIVLIPNVESQTGSTLQVNVMNYVRETSPQNLSISTDNASNPTNLLGLYLNSTTGIFTLPFGGVLSPAGSFGVVTIIYPVNGVYKTVILNVLVKTVSTSSFPMANQTYIQNVISIKPSDVTDVNYSKGYYEEIYVTLPTDLFIWPLTGPSDLFMSRIDGTDGENWAAFTGSDWNDRHARNVQIKFSPPIGTPSGFYYFSIYPKNVLGVGDPQGVLVQISGSPGIVFNGDIVLVINSPTSVTATWSKSAATNSADPSIPIDYVAELDGRTQGAGTMKRINNQLDYSFTFIDLVPGQAYTCNVVASDYTTAQSVGKSSNTVVPV